MKANTKQATGTSSSSVGVLFLSKNTKRYLFVLRNGSSYDSTWAYPGGKIEKGESEYQALQREISEEIGFSPDIVKTVPVDRFTSKNNHFTYSTYVCIVEEEFIPKLNHEHKGYAWTKLDSWPKPLHPGAFGTFKTEELLEKFSTIENLMCDST